MTQAQLERQALCDTLLAADPAAPTLCEGWTVLDLAAHLVVRERRPDAAAGMFLPPLAGRLDRVMADHARLGMPRLVELLRSGPPPWSPTFLAPVDSVVNLAELVVHHEDVRRAVGEAPRQDVADLQEAVWSRLRQAGVIALAAVRVPLVAVREDGRRMVLRPGANPVVLRGEPVELLLRLFGRSEVAQVELDGPSLSVTRFREARTGL